MAEAGIEQIILRLKRNSQLTAYAHFGAAERMSMIHYWLGIPTALISVLLGSVLVADLQNEVPSLIKWFGGVLSLISAFLASMQTIFNPKEGKSKHRVIANNYLSLNRRLEHLVAKLADGVCTLEEASVELEVINKDYDLANAEAEEFPTINKDWERAKKKIRGIENKESRGHPLADSGQ